MTVYLDTSSLVKLFLEEAGSAEVRALTATATIATSVVAYAETRATLARRRREGMLTPRTFAAAKRAFEGAWQSYARIEVTADVARQAGDFARDLLYAGSTASISHRSLRSQAAAPSRFRASTLT